MIRRSLVPAVLVCLLFLMTACAPGDGGRAEMTDAVSLSSLGSDRLMACGGSVYYGRRFFTLFGKYTGLYRCGEGAVSRVAFTTDSAGFEGVYQGKLLLRLTESSFTNYPTKLRYTLFDPADGSFRELPAPVAEFLAQDDRILMAAAGDVLFMEKDGQAWYCGPDTDGVLPLTEAPPEETGAPTPDFLYVRSGGESSLFYGINGSLQQVESPGDLGRVSLRAPDSHRVYYARDTETGSEIRCRDLAGGEDTLILETGEKVSAIMLYANDGEALLYWGVNGENAYLLRCFDLRRGCVDDAFRFTVPLGENEFVAALLVTKRDVVWVLHRTDGSEEAAAAANPRN